jgi:hypothetical protein
MLNSLNAVESSSNSFNFSCMIAISVSVERMIESPLK